MELTELQHSITRAEFYHEQAKLHHWAMTAPVVFADHMKAKVGTVLLAQHYHSMNSDSWGELESGI